MLEGIARTKGRRPTRVAAPILPEILVRLVTGLPDTPKGVHDRALILLGFGGALRRSELVALDRADLAFRDRGVTVTIRRSKTDQQGIGEELAVYGSPQPAIDVVAALTAWLALRGEAPGPLFLQADGGGVLRPDRGRLAGQAVARIVKAAAARAGYDPTKFAGHSMRAGPATAAADRDAHLHDIMRQTRHKSADVARRYIRDADLWKRNVSELVFAQAPPWPAFVDPVSRSLYCACVVSRELRRLQQCRMIRAEYGVPSLQARSSPAVSAHRPAKPQPPLS